MRQICVTVGKFSLSVLRKGGATFTVSVNYSLFLLLSVSLALSLNDSWHYTCIWVLLHQTKSQNVLTCLNVHTLSIKCRRNKNNHRNQECEENFLIKLGYYSQMLRVTRSWKLKATTCWGILFLRSALTFRGPIFVLLSGKCEPLTKKLRSFRMFFFLLFFVHTLAHQPFLPGLINSSDTFSNLPPPLLHYRFTKRLFGQGDRRQ